jgi:hypothetical protein
MVLERLARQLRADAHASESARLGASGARATEAQPSLTLSMKAAHSISYIVGDHVIARDETEGGKRTRHESYSLERGQVARFELIDDPGHRMIALRVTQEPGRSGAEPPKPLDVLASLGKHLSRPISTTEGGKP